MSSIIPEDIIADILTRLPVKPILRFRCVCKSWYNLIKNHNFVKLQLNHSLEYGDNGVLYNYAEQIGCVDYDSSSSTISNTVARIDYPLGHQSQFIIGSCNGLVCYISYQKEIIIWNPYTKDYKKIPTPPSTDTEGLGSLEIFYKYGFGYDLKTEDYKFARMANCPGRFTEIISYSLRSNSWNIKNRDIPSVYPYADHLDLFKGTLQWVDMPRPWGSEDPATIGSFDIGSKAFKEIPLPQHFPIEFDMIHVRLLRGCLYLIGSHWTYSEVWMMKEYGAPESWTRIFAIDQTKHTEISHLEPREYYRNGQILIQENNFYYCLYDINNGEAIKQKIVGIPPGPKTWPFLGSLVSTNLGT